MDDLSSPVASADISATLMGTSVVSSKSTKSIPYKAGKTSSPSTAKKRTWKKPKGKPKRPLSAYNIFFKEERANLVAEIAATKKKEGSSSAKTKGPRTHRKTHGMGFAGLAQNIAAKWKTLDSKSRRPFENKAAQNKVRYQTDVEVWKAAEKVKATKAKEEQEQALRDEQLVASSSNDDGLDVNSRRAPIEASSSNMMVYETFNKMTSTALPVEQQYQSMSLKGLLTDHQDVLEPTSIESMMMPSNDNDNAAAAAASIDLDDLLDEALDVSEIDSIPAPIVGGIQDHLATFIVPGALHDFDKSLDIDLQDFLMNL